MHLMHNFVLWEEYGVEKVILSSSRDEIGENSETFFKMDRHFSMKELVCGDPTMRWGLIEVV